VSTKCDNCEAETHFSCRQKWSVSVNIAFDVRWNQAWSSQDVSPGLEVLVLKAWVECGFCCESAVAWFLVNQWNTWIYHARQPMMTRAIASMHRSGTTTKCVKWLSKSLNMFDTCQTHHSGFLCCGGCKITTVSTKVITV